MKGFHILWLAALLVDKGLTLNQQDTGSRSGPDLTLAPAHGVVSKTVFSSKMRMVFIVGLEGTGHHLLIPVLKALCNSDGVECPSVCPIASALYRGLVDPVSAAAYQNGIERLRTEMGVLALVAERTNEDPPLYLAALNRPCRVGAMSFPNFNGPNKPLQYVDLKVLATEAERAGIDLRMIYLGRSAKDVLVSTTEHRHFGQG